MTATVQQEQGPGTVSAEKAQELGAAAAWAQQVGAAWGLKMGCRLKVGNLGLDVSRLRSSLEAGNLELDVGWWLGNSGAGASRKLTGPMLSPASKLPGESR